jgi:SOS-response transcriptional repressor LexA
LPNATLIKFESSKTVSIPVYDIRVSAGLPSQVSDNDYAERRINLPAYLIRNPDYTYAVEVSGNSMEPKMKNGDLLLVDRKLALDWQPEQLDGKVVIAFLNDEFMVKRFKYLKGKMYLCPDNTEYEITLINKRLDHFFIYGVVFKILSDP